MARILDHAGKVGLANTEEFTFRSFFMAAAYELLDKPRFQTEWGHSTSSYSPATAQH